MEGHLNQALAFAANATQAIVDFGRLTHEIYQGR
jgi:hypothetical protein